MAFAANLSRVRKFKLRMSTGRYFDETGAELRACRRLMKNGRCADLLSQADDHLEKLRDQARFTWETKLWPQTDRSRCRPCLAQIDHQSGVVGHRVKEDELVQFLEKHRATLQNLCLHDICLATGEWPHALPQMRSSIQLDCCLLEGVLSSKVPEREFRLGFISCKHTENTGNDIRCKNEKTDAINDCFCKGGKCPLTDEWSHL